MGTDPTHNSHTVEYIIIEADRGGLVGHLRALGKLHRKRYLRKTSKDKQQSSSSQGKTVYSRQREEPMLRNKTWQVEEEPER